MDLFFCSEGTQKSIHEENIPLEQKSIERGKPSQHHQQSSIESIPPIAIPSVLTEEPPISLVTEPMPNSEFHANDIELEPSPTSDSYTVPGSSGTMKETHIFTPSKPNTSNDATSLSSPPPLSPSSSTLSLPLSSTTATKSIPLDDIEPLHASDSIVIKESVVKKEYRDVEYEPNKLITSIDDFTEFQFAQPTVVPVNNPVIETISSQSNVKVQSNSINSILPDLSMVDNEIGSNDGYSPQLSSFDNLKNSSTLQPLPISLQSNEKIAGNLTNVNSLSNGNRSDLEFYSINDQFSTTSNAHKNIPSGNMLNDTNNYGCAITDPMEIFSISSSDQIHSLSTMKSAQNPSMNSHEIFQQQQSPLQQPKPNNTTMNSNKFVSNSGILTPQMATTQPLSLSAINNNALSIQWPEPGINSDELNELERRFSTQSIESIKVEKTNDQKDNADTNAADDEWSDFVSVVQTPITNILNKNLLKQQQQNSNDEDDWSEFVSSTPPNLQQRSQNSIGTIDATMANNSWNTPIFQTGGAKTFGNYMVQSNAMRHNLNNSLNIESSTFQIHQQQHHQSIAPSIISLPDLGFAAPKSLINMPNISKAKK